MSIFQILATLFALLMLYVASIHYKKRAIGNIEASFWFSTWVFFILISLFPELLLGITGVLRFSRVFDLLIVAALMLLSVVSFYGYFKIKTLHKKLETLIRKEALEQHVKNSSKAKKI